MRVNGGNASLMGVGGWDAVSHACDLAGSLVSDSDLL